MSTATDAPPEPPAEPPAPADGGPPDESPGHRALAWLASGMAALASPRMLNILAEARELFDWVIVDTPPIGLLSDANLLTKSIDGVIFVVKAGSTPYDLVKRGLDALGPERLLGIVLNRAVAGAHRYGYGYQHYSTYHDKAKQSGEP